MNISKIVFSGDKEISPEQIDKLRTLGLHNKCRFPGKTVRVTEAIQYNHDPQPGYRGLLSGKPLTWWLRPRLYPGYRYKYEIIQ